MRRAGYSVIDGSHDTLSGLDAHIGVYRGSLSGVGKVVMRAAHVAMGRQVFVFAGFAPRVSSVKWIANRPGTEDVSRAQAREASQVRPNRLTYYTVKAGATRGSRSRSAPAGASPTP